MTKKTYDLDLRGFDIKEFLLNPMVVFDFDFVEPPVGRAVIAPDGLSVEVEFTDESINPLAPVVAGNASECLPAYVEDGGAKELVALSLRVKPE